MVSVLQGLLVQWDTDKWIGDEDTGDKGELGLSGGISEGENCETACEGVIEGACLQGPWECELFALPERHRGMKGKRWWTRTDELWWSDRNGGRLLHDLFIEKSRKEIGKSRGSTKLLLTEKEIEEWEAWVRMYTSASERRWTHGSSLGEPVLGCQQKGYSGTFLKCVSL